MLADKQKNPSLVERDGPVCWSAVPPCFPAGRGAHEVRVHTSARDNGWQTRLRLLPGLRARGSGSGSGGISASTFRTRLSPSAGSLERIFEAALSPSAPILNLSACAGLFN